jgi:hypothetical protein
MSPAKDADLNAKEACPPGESTVAVPEILRELSARNSPIKEFIPATQKIEIHCLGLSKMKPKCLVKKRTPAHNRTLNEFFTKKPVV